MKFYVLDGLHAVAKDTDFADTGLLDFIPLKRTEQANFVSSQAFHPHVEKRSDLDFLIIYDLRQQVLRAVIDPHVAKLPLHESHLWKRKNNRNRSPSYGERGALVRSFRFPSNSATRASTSAIRASRS